MLKRVRGLLVRPLYLLAFIFHLLTALFTWIADVASGTTHLTEQHREEQRTGLSWVLIVAFVAAAIALVWLDAFL